MTRKEIPTHSEHIFFLLLHSCGTKIASPNRPINFAGPGVFRIKEMRLSLLTTKIEIGARETSDMKNEEASCIIPLLGTPDTQAEAGLW